MLGPIFTIGALAALLFASPTHALLTPRYDHGGLGTGLHGQVEAEGVWTRYDTIVLLHGEESHYYVLKERSCGRKASAV